MHLLRPGMSALEELKNRKLQLTPAEKAEAACEDATRQRLGWGIYVSSRTARMRFASSSDPLHTRCAALRLAARVLVQHSCPTLDRRNRCQLSMGRGRIFFLASRQGVSRGRSPRYQSRSAWLERHFAYDISVSTAI